MAWEIFTLVKDLLIENVFGSALFFGLFLVFLLIVLFMAARVSPVYAILGALPLTYGLALQGWFGAEWVKALVILILTGFWAFVVWRLIE